MAWTGLKLTVDGRNALNRAQTEGRLCFKSLVVGDGNPPANFGTQKGLVHELYELTDIKIDMTPDGCALTADFPALDYDYYFREIGVIAVTDEGEKLYVYDNCGDDAQYIVSSKGAERTQKRIRIYLAISDVADITVSAPSILYVDYDDYEQEIERLDEAIDAAKMEASEALAGHTGNKSNPHAVTKAQVGLGNADNTADINKPVSTAQQAAINAAKKEMTDALAGHTGNKSNPHAVTKAQVGLGNVNNTSDANKPVSTAQQAALDALYQQLTQYTDKEIADLVNGAPGTLDTLGEIAEAMQDNGDVVTALEQAIGTKAGKAETESALAGKVSRAGGDMTGNLTMGNTSMSDAPEIHWIDKFRKIWAGMCNGAGDWYLYDATNNKSIIQSTKAGAANFYGNAASATKATQDGNGNNILNTYQTKTGDAKDNTVTFTSADVADGSATAWTSVAKLTTGEKLSSFFNKISTMFKNVRYLYKMLGTTDISAIGGGTVTGAISKLNTDLGAKVAKSGDTMIGPLYIGNGAGTNSPAIVWWDKNRNVWAGTANGGGDFYLYDHTNSKHIIQSTKAGVNNFNGHAVSAGTATYAQNATGNLRTELDNKWTKSGKAPTQTIPTGVNFGYDNATSGTKGFFVDFVFGDGTKSRLIYNSSSIENWYYNGSVWHKEWAK